MYNDPYLSTERCVDRLYAEYKAHNKLIIAVDFDDTVFDFHNTGNRYDLLLNLLYKCQKLGFYIVIFSASHPDRHEFMKQYLAEKGITVNSVNENPVELPYGNHGKIFYNIFLDDRSGLSNAYEILDTVIYKITKETSQ